MTDTKLAVCPMKHALISIIPLQCGRKMYQD